MKVRAIKPGYYGDDLKQPGDVFEVKDGAKAKWFVPVVGGEPDEPAGAEGKVSAGGSRRPRGSQGPAGAPASP